MTAARYTARVVWAILVIWAIVVLIRNERRARSDRR